MRRYISFSCTREGAEAATQPPELALRKTSEAARQSLVNVAGLNYPLLQPASLWGPAYQVDQGVSFEFTRQGPRGDVHFGPDLSFQATREPTDDEGDPPVIFLEALTWEFVFTMMFFHRFVLAFARPGTFRIGLGFTAFQGAQVDWAGFREEADQPLTNWRFQPPREVVTYEASGVAFPAHNENLVPAVSDVIAAAASAVKGLRRTATGRSESPLKLSRASIEAVVTAALAAL